MKIKLKNKQTKNEINIKNEEIILANKYLPKRVENICFLTISTFFTKKSKKIILATQIHTKKMEN